MWARLVQFSVYNYSLALFSQDITHYSQLHTENSHTLTHTPASVVRKCFHSNSWSTRTHSIYTHTQTHTGSVSHLASCQYKVREAFTDPAGREFMASSHLNTIRRARTSHNSEFIFKYKHELWPLQPLAHTNITASPGPHFHQCVREKCSINTEMWEFVESSMTQTFKLDSTLEGTWSHNSAQTHSPNFSDWRRDDCSHSPNQRRVKTRLSCCSFPTLLKEILTSSSEHEHLTTAKLPPPPPPPDRLRHILWYPISSAAPRKTLLQWYKVRDTPVSLSFTDTWRLHKSAHTEYTCSHYRAEKWRRRRETEQMEEESVTGNIKEEFKRTGNRKWPQEKQL